MKTLTASVRKDEMKCNQYNIPDMLVLLDLATAFDTVDHNTLLKRLKGIIGISGCVLEWVSSYLTDRRFCVSFNQMVSELKGLCCEVPQGLVLDPILFLLYLTPPGQIITQFIDREHPVCLPSRNS